MQVINEMLTELLLGDPSQYRNLVVFPLLAKTTDPPGYLTLDEALERGSAEVAEVSAGGHVPELRFVNRAEKDVLLVDGEELVGAKQNRVLNLTILVGAGHTVTIPVSCVEHGRWHYRTQRFASGKRNLYGRLRAKKMASVTFSLREANSRCSDQAEIWDDIAAKCMRMEACSDTGAMDALYEDHSERLTRYAETLKPAANQAGAVFVINGRVAGLELFDSPKTFARLVDKLIGSFAVDALEEPGDGAAPPSQAVVQEFVERLKASQSTEHLAVDLGVDLRLTGDKVVGGALVVEGRIVHLSAFNLEDGDTARNEEVIEM